MFEQNPQFTVTLKPRDYKCTVNRMEAIADEWMGKPLEFALDNDDEIAFGFPRKEWSVSFLESIQNMKL
jgi:flagellar basal body P-ring protein FlgI